MVAYRAKGRFWQLQLSNLSIINSFFLTGVCDWEMRDVYSWLIKDGSRFFACVRSATFWTFLFRNQIPWKFLHYWAVCILGKKETSPSRCWTPAQTLYLKFPSFRHASSFELDLSDWREFSSLAAMNKRWRLLMLAAVMEMQIRLLWARWWQPPPDPSVLRCTCHVDMTGTDLWSFLWLIIHLESKEWKLSFDLLLS